MAWDDEMVTVVRGLIGDLDIPPKYADDRISTILLIAANYVKVRTTFVPPQSYTVSIPNGTLSPDPTLKSTRDDNFINLTSLKAAAIIVTAEVKQFTAQGISIRDGSSAVSLSRSPASLQLLQKTYSDAFEDALYDYITTGGNAPVGEAIVGPVKAWYLGGGYPGMLDYGTYGGPERVGRGPETGSSWFGSGDGRGGAYDNWEAGGNWGV